MKKPIRLYCAFRESAHGVALIEFAIVLPFLIIMLFGGIELSRYILINLKLDKAGFLIADILSQSNQAKSSWVSCTLTKTGVSETEVSAAMAQLDRVMASFSSADREMVIVTSVSRVSPNNVIQWRMSGGGGNLTAGVVSKINNAGPNNICCNGTIAAATGDIKTQLDSLPNGQNLIVAEVFYSYAPILQNILTTSGITIPPKIISRQVFIRARNGALTNIFDTYPPTEPAKPGGC